MPKKKRRKTKARKEATESNWLLFRVCGAKTVFASANFRTESSAVQAQAAKVGAALAVLEQLMRTGDTKS